MTSAAATVVVSRRVRAQDEDRFRRWLKRLLRAVRAAPGYAGAVVEPPDETHPDHWVIRYTFESSSDLDSWLSSSKRIALLEQGRNYLLDSPVEQRVLQPSGGAVTLVSSVRLRSGTEAEHRQLHDRGVEEARKMGLVRAELFPAQAGAQPETVAMLTFASKQDLDRWMTSAERHEVLEAMAALATTERTTSVIGGFAGWFSDDDTGPPRWKQALTVILALIPVSIAVSLLRDFVAPGLHYVAAIAINTVVNVCLLTWVVMPALTRALSGWLNRH